MKPLLKARLNDNNLSAENTSTQRQLEISVQAVKDSSLNRLPLNLCIILDHSGSMVGKPLENVKQAAIALIEKLNQEDRVSVVGFNHQATVVVNSQPVADLETIKTQINQLRADGGTAIDEGMKLGIQQINLGKENRVSQILLLTDGENEHGSNEKCLKLAKMSSEYNITLNAMGFGNNWNQKVLEAISDCANGTLTHIEFAEQAKDEFQKLLTRMESVGLTNAFLIMELGEDVRMAELKPMAQVAPETVELEPQREDDYTNKYTVRLGDLMTTERIILTNLYLGKLSLGSQAIAKIKVQYDDIKGQTMTSEEIPVNIQVQAQYQPQNDAEIQKSLLTLAKYRQTRLAQEKIEQGDNKGAATLLQNAAKTALQLGDQSGATVLQTSATRLQTGQKLSESEKKKTQMAAKTTLQL
ncbi:VWA domain-containing protein [Cyanobacterium stanieri LEGE 03274]|uniref:VWA domain-containing protein n=1 Tax=Cyanobacterium stanieri LEGE 03274 TaxID=1828756 RepID=A0ABR9V0X5_9CHRO|nr:VWA domain-containing protein [Cyanobacterium stanieri]MBE9221525.1 VWA domain-containing protein [Cyanobacterium stanieri LEGE 03274]